MLSGLLFARDDADDRPGTLIATLPFGAGTIIEYQARLLADAGAKLIVLAVSRISPDLLAATARLAARGIRVDLARDAAEAAAKFHPNDRVLLFADGLIVGAEPVAELATQTQSVLVVRAESDALPTDERIDARHHWAGLALLESALLAETAAELGEWDLQSTMLRRAVQRSVRRIEGNAAPAAAPVVVRTARLLVERDRARIAMLAPREAGWVETRVVAPLVARILPPLLDRAVAPRWVDVAAGLLGLGAVAAAGYRHVVIAGLVGLLAMLVMAVRETVAALDLDTVTARRRRLARAILAAILLLLVGWTASGDSGQDLPLAAAIVAIALAWFSERLPVRPRPAWLLTPIGVCGWMIVGGAVGLVAWVPVVIAAHAMAGLGQLVERARGHRLVAS